MSFRRFASAVSPGSGSVLLACGERSRTAVLVVTPWWS